MKRDKRRRGVLLLTLTLSETRKLSRLLGSYQTQLEAAIESELIPGETEPRTSDRQVLTTTLKNDWRLAERFQKMLEKALDV